MGNPLQRLTEIAESQWGLFTRAQAGDAGVRQPTLANLTRRGLTERISHGVYRVRGSSEPDHLALRAAWLQLDPDTPAWDRFNEPSLAIVSHTSAAAMYQLGDLRADVHEFTVPVRKQSRRSDVRLHRGTVSPTDWIILGGLPVTRAGRTISDLLTTGVDLEAIAGITAEALARNLDYPSVISEHLAPHAARFGFRRGDGKALFEYLLVLAGYRQQAQSTVSAVA